jgi:signal transduction histidine kinase/ligand-binding sensor domain-containing protein
LFSFDGFRIRREPLAPGAERATLQTAKADDHGRLWVATDAGLFLRRQKHGVPDWIPVTQPSGALIGVEAGQRLDVDERGIVYAIDRQNRIWSIDVTASEDAAPVAQRMPMPEFSPPPGGFDADSAALRVGRGALWFGCGRGLCEWRGGALHVWGEAEGLPARAWGTLVIGRDGSVWARSSDRLASLRPGDRRFSAVEAPLARRLPATAALVEDPTGNIIAATDAGIARWDGRRWQEWTPKQGLPETLVRSLLFDAEGELWLGTNGRGLHHWVGYQQVDHWTPALGLPAPAAFSFVRDGRGRLWVGTPGGVAWLDEATQRFQPLPTPSSGAEKAVGALALDAGGNLWWIQAGQVMRLKPGAASADRIFSDPSLSEVMQGKEGGIYLSGRHGVDRIVASSSGRPRREPVADGLPERDWVDSIAVAGTGAGATEWFISDHRASRVVDGAWVPMRDQFGQLVEVYGYATFASPTEFWAFEPGSVAIYMLNGDGVARLQRRLDLAWFGGPTAYFLRTAPDGQVWFGTDQGVFIFDGKHWSHRDRTSGLLWDDIDGNAVLLEADGTAWIGTSAGVTRIRAGLAKPAPPVLRIETLRFGGKVVPPSSAEMEVPWNDRHLQLTLATPNIGRASALQVEYRLDGSASWEAIEGNVVTIESSDAGAHVLEVRAAHGRSIIEAGPPLRFAFSVAPPWWLSTPAKLATVAGLVLLWWLSNLVVNRRQRADRRRLEHAVADRTSELEASQQALRRFGEHNAHALEDERKRIARELHDEMGQQLAALRMEASVLRVHARGERPPAQEQFQLLLDRIDQLAGGVRALVKQLRPPALDGGLAAALEWLASEFTQVTSVPCRVQVDTAADGLAQDTATQLFRVAQESLTNVRRYSRAAQVDIALQRDGAGWVLTVTDDGVGFDPEGERSGHGLLGMEERARLLGGSLEVDSAPGAGTTVRLRFAAAESR